MFQVKSTERRRRAKDKAHCPLDDQWVKPSGMSKSLSIFESDELKFLAPLAPLVCSLDHHIEDRMRFYLTHILSTILHIILTKVQNMSYRHFQTFYEAYDIYYLVPIFNK